MTKQEAYDIWAPRDGIWSEWAKPVLFAHMDRLPPPRLADVPPPLSLSFVPSADRRMAVVVDLPGSRGISAGLVLATRGYRPVPLYNAVPPRGTITSLCDVAPIIRALRTAAILLKQVNVPADAPPVFLLDSLRRVGSGVEVPETGAFDNRSISLITDFPSANLLLSRGIVSALLIQQDDLWPQADLSHTLLRWKQVGMQIRAVALENPALPTPIHIKKPRLFRVLWQRMLATIGLCHAPLGGFGGELSLSGAAG